MSAYIKYIPAIIRFLYYSLFVLVPLVMSSKTSEMFEFNKMMMIYLLAILISFLYLVHYIAHRKKVYMPVLILVFGVFLASQILSAFFSIDTHTSMWGYYGRWNGGLVSLSAYFALIFVFIQTFDKKHVFTLLKNSLLASTFVILWGLPAKFGGDLSCLLFTGNFTNACWTAQFQPAVRMFSTLGQPNWMGAYLAVHFFIGLYFFLQSFLTSHHSIMSLEGIQERLIQGFKKLFHIKDHSWSVYIYGIYLVLNILGLLFTKSRSSLIAVGVAMIIGVVLMLTESVKKPLRLLYRSVLIISILVATYFGISYVSTSFAADVPAHLEITDSLTIRKIVWQGALELGLRHPLVGTGPETFAYSYYSVKPIEHNRTSEWDFIYNKAHNEFLNYFATTGFLGLVSYLSVIALSYWYLSRKLGSRDYESALLSLMLVMSFTTIQITNFFGFSTSSIQILMIILPPAMYVVQRKNQPSDVQSPSKSVMILQIAAVTVVASVLLWNLLSYYRADRLYKQAQAELNAEEYQEASRLLVQALKLKQEHVYEDKLSSSLAHLGFISSFDGDTSTTSDLVDLSRASNTDALRKSPENIQYWRTKAKNGYLYYQISGDIAELEKAVDSMRYTTILAPNDAQSYYMLGLFYTLIDQEQPDAGYDEKALQSINKALELRPNYIEAQELRGSI